jgi:hypothetical protein
LKQDPSFFNTAPKLGPLDPPCSAFGFAIAVDERKSKRNRFAIATRFSGTSFDN